VALSASHGFGDLVHDGSSALIGIPREPIGSLGISSLQCSRLSEAGETLARPMPIHVDCGLFHALNEPSCTT